MSGHKVKAFSSFRGGTCALRHTPPHRLRDYHFVEEIRRWRRPNY